MSKEKQLPATSSNNSSTKAEQTPSSAIKRLGHVLGRLFLLASLLIFGLVLLGIAQRRGWVRFVSTESPQAADVGSEVYTCPMHPQIRQNAEGDCPICGMPLVTASNTARSDDQSVAIDPVARRLVGIRTAIATEESIHQTIRTIGTIQFDESRLATISGYVAGRIEKLYANYIGVPVTKDDDLALLYSPELYTAQIEYLSALKRNRLSRRSDDQEIAAPDLAALAKEKLVELGMTDDQLNDLKDRGKAESRIRIRSPISGTVIEKHALEGDYITEGQAIFRIADLSTVWLMLELFPADASRIRFGQTVRASVSSLPGKIFAGRVAFIHPSVNDKTRTVRVRVEMPNPNGNLRPGDYATATIQVPAIAQDQIYDPELAGKFISPMHPQIIRGRPGECPICDMPLIPTTQLGYSADPVPEMQVVTVPRDSVLIVGEKSVLYVETDPGRFEIRRVYLGPMTDTRAVILEGVSPGEKVALDGNFLIDSQMQLIGNPSLMDPGKAKSYPEGPLSYSDSKPVTLPDEASLRFDQAFDAYFEIQESLAGDQTPRQSDVLRLQDSLSRVLSDPAIPQDLKAHLWKAKYACNAFEDSIDASRRAFRRLSHAMLNAVSVARGQTTSRQLVHVHCPMVPGGGGDWMQPGGEVQNPYWGSAMLRCGNVVRDLTIKKTPSDLSADREVN